MDHIVPAISTEVKSIIAYLKTYQMWVPSQHGECDAVTQEETSIATGVFHNLPCMHEGSNRSLWHHLWAHYNTYHDISAKVNSQIAYKNQDFRYAFGIGNRMLCCKERHPLLLDSFISFLICMSKMGVASDSIYKAIMDHIMPFSVNVNYQIAYKMSYSGNPLSTGNGMV